MGGPGKVVVWVTGLICLTVAVGLIATNGRKELREAVVELRNYHDEARAELKSLKERVDKMEAQIKSGEFPKPVPRRVIGSGPDVGAPPAP